MIDKRVNVSRPDGRPEAYDVPDTLGLFSCALCCLEGKADIRYKPGEIFICSPIDSSDGQSHLLCKGHVPVDIVIYNPATNKCRDRNGTDVWEETTPGFVRPFTGAKQ